MNVKQIGILIRTARSRIGMASEVIAESRRRLAPSRGQDRENRGARVAVIAPEATKPMADDARKRGGQGERIDVNQDPELRDWAQKLGVSEEQVREAVKAVGEQADKVRQHLGR